MSFSAVVISAVVYHRTKRSTPTELSHVMTAFLLTSLCEVVATPRDVELQQMASFYTQRCQWNVNVSPHNTENTEAVCLICAVLAE